MNFHNGRFDAANQRRKTEKHIKDVRMDLLAKIEEAEDLEDIKKILTRFVSTLRLLTQ